MERGVGILDDWPMTVGFPFPSGKAEAQGSSAAKEADNYDS
jgi:hypothetical protein